MCCLERDEENDSQQKTEETHCIFNDIIEEVSYRNIDPEGNTYNDHVPFVQSASYPDVFSYRWIGMSSQILIPNFLEQGLKNDFTGPHSRNYEPSLIIFLRTREILSFLEKEVIKTR